MKKRFLKIGLTGALGAGKSTAAKMFGDLGAAVFSADEAAASCLRDSVFLNSRLPDFFLKEKNAGKKGRDKLRHLVLERPEILKQLEAILHPAVWKKRDAFLRAARKEGKRIAIMEIPLLFETGADDGCDATLCINAPEKIRKRRALGRKGMTESLYRALCKRQMSGKEKAKRATYVVRSDRGKRKMRKDIGELWGKLLEGDE